MRHAVADLFALLLFSVLGAAFHRVGPDAGLVVRTFLPLALSWLVVAGLLGTYRVPGWKSFVVTWAVALPLGILLRQALLGRLTSPGTLPFLLVGTATSGLVVASVRLAVHRWVRTGSSRDVAS